MVCRGCNSWIKQLTGDVSRVLTRSPSRKAEAPGTLEGEWPPWRPRRRRQRRRSERVPGTAAAASCSSWSWSSWRRQRRRTETYHVLAETCRMTFPSCLLLFAETLTSHGSGCEDGDSSSISNLISTVCRRVWDMYWATTRWISHGTGAGVNSTTAPRLSDTYYRNFIMIIKSRNTSGIGNEMSS